MPYVYVLVRKDLSLEQIVVQASHACMESARAFLAADSEIPHLVVCGIENELRLYNVLKKTEQAGIRCKAFTEPDFGNELTAFATEPVYGEQRRLFKSWKCLTFSQGELVC